MAKKKINKESLGSQVFEKVSSGCAGIWVQSFEHEEAVAEIEQLCLTKQWDLYVWDAFQGLMQMSHDLADRAFKILPPENANLQDALKHLGESTAHKIVDAKTHETVKDADGGQVRSLLILKNAQLGLDSMFAIQQLANQIWNGRTECQHVIGLSPTSTLPPELDKLFVLIEHPLPDREQLQAILEGIVTEEETPQGEAMEHVIDAAAGMTRLEAETAFCISIQRHGAVDPFTVFESKANMLRKGNRALTLYRGEENFDSVGGLDQLKAFSKDILEVRETNYKFRARGLMLVGVTGAGKTLFCKALANEVNRPLLICDLGATFGGLLGQSQQRMRDMLQKLDAMAPCMLLIDEIEKAVAGLANGGRSDGGAKIEMVGALLTWLNDHKSDVFTIASANSVKDILENNPELLRAGRFDGMFMIDFPNRAAKDAIWKIHLLVYKHIVAIQRVANAHQNCNILAFD